MKKLCVFDLDGTLVDSLPDIAAALDGALAALGLPGFSPEEYRLKVGNGAKTLCARCLPPGKEGLLPALLTEYNRRYLRACAGRTVPYPGVPGLLRRLREAGVKTAVISNKPHAQTREVLSSVLADTPVDLAFGQRENVPLKPAPDALLEALDVLGINPGDALYIGDAPEDVRFGRAAGVPTCSVLWGYRSRAQLSAENPDFFAESPEEILTLVEG